VDELQDRLVRVGLATLTEHGFALAGGYALQAHGLIDRLSEDVDLFTDRWDTAEFSRAVDALAEAYRRAGLDLIVARRAETFARPEATEPASGQAGAVDLAADVPASDPVGLSIGPDLAEWDAVASKHSMILTSNRSPSDWYPLFPNAVVGESVLDRVINSSHHLLLDGKSYRPNRRPGPPKT
jgi:hypothetical protein